MTQIRAVSLNQNIKVEAKKPKQRHEKASELGLVASNTFHITVNYLICCN